METTREILSLAEMCASDSAALQRFYELVAAVLSSIASSEQQQQAEAA